MADLQLSDELKAMAQIENALSGLTEEMRSRVLRWAGDRFGVAFEGIRDKQGAASPDKEEKQTEATEYGELSEFYGAVAPSTEADRALVVAYWFQYKQGQEDFEAQQVNKELKHLGHRVGNITVAFNTLKKQKPALVVQTRKEGTTKQARKKYRVTVEGKKAVEKMLTQETE